MLGTNSTSMLLGQPSRSQSTASAGKSDLNSPALSVDSSGSSTVRGTPEGRRDNRWSGSSLSRSNSDSSTLLKARAQHGHSASVPHIVNIRSGGANAGMLNNSTTPLNSQAIASPNIYSSTNDKGSSSTQLPPLPEKPTQPPDKFYSKPKAPSKQTSGSRKTRQHRSPSQRAMLSSALQKANTAVMLDNASNIEGAMEAYADACKLLQQAMLRAALEEDKIQLQSIHDTYINRIEQLRAISPRMDSNEKELPARPLTQEFIDGIDSIREEDEQQFEEDQYYADEEESGFIYSTDTSSSTITQRRYQQTATVVPPRRDSLFIAPGSIDGNYYHKGSSSQFSSKVSQGARMNLPSPIAESYRGDDIFERGLEQRAPLGIDSSSRSINHQNRPSQDRQDFIGRSASASSTSSKVSSNRVSSNVGHSRGSSEVSTSWLNTIDESGGSVSGDSTFEGREWGKKRGFEDELDAAVEAAYDDEDDDQYDISEFEIDGLVVMKKGEAGKEPVEVGTASKVVLGGERQQKLREKVFDSDLDFFDDHDEDEEEARILEDMANGYLLDDFEFDLGAKTALPRDPRESSSSSMSASTWISSLGSKKSSVMSHGYASGTALSSVAELPPSRPPSVPPPPPPPPPPAELPPPHVPLKKSFENIPKVPKATSTPPPSSPPRGQLPPPVGGSPGKSLQSSLSMTTKSSGVRSRRLSGLTARPLKIETDSFGSSSVTSELATATSVRGLVPQPPNEPPPPPPTDVSEVKGNGQLPLPPIELITTAPSPKTIPEQPPPVPLKTAGTVKPFPSPLPTSENDSALSPMPYPLSGISNETPTPRSGSPARFASKISNLPGLRQINSSASLKGLNKASTTDETTSPITPGPNSLFNSSSTTNLRSAKIYPITPTPPTPGMVPMTPTMNYSFQASAALSTGALSTGGLHLFDSKLHSPTTPGSPNALIQNPPAPLEPCPSEPHSRPFWLMRCLYQTIAHPRGGYISARLFVPRDVWLMKGVKIKAVDDKISACDLVSAALAKLAIIQSGDVNAIFEEMQALENVLDRVQAMLSKKLGNEVGAAGATALYGSSQNGDATSHDGATGKGTGSSGKSYLSWRKLRSKNSNSALTSTYAAEAAFENSSFPMASPRVNSDHPAPPERNLKAVSFTGPNAAYIASLARLFDAAQVLDRLPALDTDSMSKQTQVGLQLSQKHAAEFFGLYICRFVLSDLTMLLDKFLKKGTEWVGS